MAGLAIMSQAFQMKGIRRFKDHRCARARNISLASMPQR